MPPTIVLVKIIHKSPQTLQTLHLQTQLALASTQLLQESYRKSVEIYTTNSESSSGFSSLPEAAAPAAPAFASTDSRLQHV